MRRPPAPASRRSFASSDEPCVKRGGACSVLVAIAALASLAACGKGRAASDPYAASAPPDAGFQPNPRSISLGIDFAGRQIHVRVEASGTPDDVRVWNLGADVDHVEVLDSSEHPLKFRRDGHRIEVQGGEPTTLLRYDFVLPDEVSRSEAGPDEDPQVTLLEPHRFRGIGERILALPEAFEKTVVPLFFQQTAREPGLVVASSFSTGRVRIGKHLQEGVARWVAREQLMRVGLLSADEYATEVDRLLARVTTSRHTARPMKDLVVDRATPGVVALIVARGALFATVADARIREASHGARSFDDVLRALAERAGETNKPLPGDAVGVLLAGEIGEARAREDFEDFVSMGRKKKLPEAALGACFEASEVAYDLYEPGFDVAASRSAHAVVGVVPRGPAATAGLRNGDVLLTADVPERVDQTAKVEVTREDRRVTVTYRPLSGSRRGQAFRRRPSLGEEACRKLALRH